MYLPGELQNTGKHTSVVSKNKGTIVTIKGLAIFVEAGLSRRQYEIIRTNDKKLYPCYTILQNAKKDCYPVPDSYQVTATSAEINLQDLMDHTAS